ncbi:MAG: LysE family translocator [Alphaproteobacteria bacterium]|nr:LysE family translocator [Alphaproteobacteria bacterium]
MRQDVASYGSNGFDAAQFNGSSGKCGFTLTQTLFAITPGPAVLLTVSHGMKSGWGVSLKAALGAQAGNGIYFLLSAVGLGAILSTSETLFHIVKYAGAAYLIYIGIRTIWQSTRAAEPQRAYAGILTQPFVQAVLTQLANPKSVLFFGALMPQFIDPSGDLLLQYALFAAACVLSEMPVLAVYGWLAAQGRRAFVGPKVAIWRERLSGGALVAVGASLAAIKRSAP